MIKKYAVKFNLIKNVSLRKYYFYIFRYVCNCMVVVPSQYYEWRNVFPMYNYTEYIKQKDLFYMALFSDKKK